MDLAIWVHGRGFPIRPAQGWRRQGRRAAYPFSVVVPSQKAKAFVLRGPVVVMCCVRANVA
eukprot:9119840-Lingulodinium_polyedra.AAC.1